MRQLIFGAALLAAPAVAAEPSAKDKAVAHYEEGVALFEAGEFVEAAERFQLAYNLDPSPVLLYNLARAHEQAGDFDAAALHFRTYLDRYPDAADREDVEQRIAALRERKEALEARQDGPPDVDDADAWMINPWLALGFGGTVEPDELQLDVGGAAQDREGDEEDLESNFGLGVAVERRVHRHVLVGGQAFYATGEAEDRDIGLEDLRIHAFDVGPLVRGWLPLAPRWALRGGLWAGLSYLFSDETSLFGSEDFSFSGVGWHLGGSAGGVYAVTDDLRVHVDLAVVRQAVDAESDAFRVGVREASAKLDNAVLVRWYLNAGVMFDL